MKTTLIIAAIIIFCAAVARIYSKYKDKIDEKTILIYNIKNDLRVERDKKEKIENERDSLRGAVAELRVELEEVNHALNDEKKKNKQLESECVKHFYEIKGLKAFKTEYEAAASSATDYMNKLEDENSSLRNDIDRLKEAMENAKVAYAVKCEECDSLRAKIDSMTSTSDTEAESGCNGDFCEFGPEIQAAIDAAIDAAKDE